MRWVTVAVACALLPAAAGCSANGESRELTVFAASSLTDAFTALGSQFEDRHPDLDVTFNFAASSTLARQINAGSPADVFVAADARTMQTVVDAGNARAPVTVATNRMMLLVALGNPLSIDDLEGLARQAAADRDLVVVMCAPEVPCGHLAAEVLQKAGIADFEAASLERNVKAVVTKVTLGEADAGLVYATDVEAAGADATGVELDLDADPSLRTTYLAAVTADSSRPAAARAWIELLRSSEGREVLDDFGFGVP